MGTGDAGVVVAALFSGLATSVEAALGAATTTQSVVHRGRPSWTARVLAGASVVASPGDLVSHDRVGYGRVLHGEPPIPRQNSARAEPFLILVGCLMEIFPAIVVVVPLIVPLGEAFNVHPVHLGIIFIANLELGYLTPLVGLNILLASYRFKRPVLEVARAALPMAGILGIGVLVITYVPWLTLGLLEMLGRI